MYCIFTYTFPRAQQAPSKYPLNKRIMEPGKEPADGRGHWITPPGAAAPGHVAWVRLGN